MTDGQTTRDAARVRDMFLDQVGRAAASSGLPGDDRVRLHDRLATQIDAGIATAREGEEVSAALAVIDALGDPAAIVGGAGPARVQFTKGGQPVGGQAGDLGLGTLRQRGALELIAVLLIIFHPVVPGPGLLACIVCLALSDRWTVGEKIFGAVAAMIWSVGLIAAMFAYVGVSADGFDPAFGLLAVTVLGIPLFAAVWLWSAARIRSPLTRR